ncbi:MAG: LPXTG cell wall anchor domain-containing protein, partial [Lachnospiraceae bacterium]|nr:LPXTG cell wall anchor domain-containing protein [Lachnospiraceae bacterium]
GATGVVFKAGDLIATLTTDKYGEAEVDNLYLGNYYVKEITPSEGYLLDEEEHDLVCDYEGDMVAEVSRSTTSMEQVIKQPFQLIKVSDNGEDTEAPLLSGAGFTAYLKSSLSVKEDGSYDFASATPVIIGADGKTEIFSDEKGHVVSIAIPYGTYVVIESTTPHNMETIKPFEVKITENNPTTPQIWRVFLDREFTAKLRVIKKDADTGMTVLIPNTEFKIFNMDTNEYVEMITTYPSKETHTSFFTDGDGDLILPDVLPLGTYRIEEVAAPYGYVINDEYVTVMVDTDTFYEIDPDTYEAIITVDYVDEPAVGELTVEKKGEVLDAYKGGLFADSEEKEFVYREGSLAGAKFEVYAAEDIYTADMQVDENGNRTKYYSAGDLVATIVTGEDGKATLSDLPLGSYKVVEVEAPYGYVLNKEEQVVTFAYVDDKTPVIYESVTFANDRQKVDLSVVKMDKETELPIAGAEFGLYAKEDIFNVDGEIIIEKDTLLEVAVSGTDGRIEFVKDYPLGTYYAKEIKAPHGYVSSEEIVDYNAAYQGQDVKVVKLESEFVNTPTTVEITKTDITSEAELSGATLTVTDSEGNVIDTWTSVAGEAHVIKRLHVGEVYTLREEFAPYGYLQAEEIQFTISDTEDVQYVEMQDEVPTGTIVINKDGEFLTDINLIKGHWYDFVFDYFKKSLAGVTFEVYATEDIVSPDGLNTVYYAKDTFVAEMVTNDKGIASIENLPLGKYYLVETKTLEGFVLDSEPIMADLSYVDQYTEVVYAGMEITNERQKVQVTVIKTDAETKKELEGAIFGLYAAEDIVNADGKIIVSKDTLVEKAVTGTDGKCVFLSDLPLGQYYVKEIEAPKGYVLNEEIFALDASYQGDDVKVIELEATFANYPTKLEISKTDITGEYELKGATLSIIDKDGNVVETWKSDGETHYIERIPVGEYILREEAAPYGYKIANEVKFTVENTKEIQKVSMKDELVSGKIIIEKTDEVTGKGIAGVEFEIRDKDGKVIETLVTDKNGHAESKELPIAVFKDGNFVEDIKYFVVETKAAEGYILDSTPHEVVLQYDDEAPEVVTYTLSVTNKPTEPKLPQTGDNMNPWLYVGIGMFALLAGVGACFFKKKEEDVTE